MADLIRAEYESRIERAVAVFESRRHGAQMIDVVSLVEDEEEGEWLLNSDSFAPASLRPYSSLGTRVLGAYPTREKALSRLEVVATPKGQHLRIK